MSELFILLEEVRNVQRGSFESLIESLEGQLDKIGDEMGVTLIRMATFEDHCFALSERGLLYRADYVLDENMLPEVVSFNDADVSVVAPKKEFGKRVCESVQMSSKLIMGGLIDEATDIVSRYSSFLEQGAGSWVVECLSEEVATEVASYAPWKTKAMLISEAVVIEMSETAGIDISEFGLSESWPIATGSEDKKKLIQSALKQRIGLSVSLAAAVSESVSRVDAGLKPTAEALHSDVVALSSRLSEALKYSGSTDVDVLESFHRSASRYLRDLAKAFVVVAGER